MVKLDVADFRDKNEEAIVSGSGGSGGPVDEEPEDEDYKEALNQFTKEMPTNHTTKEKDREEVSDKWSGSLSGT